MCERVDVYEALNSVQRRDKAHVPHVFGRSRGAPRRTALWMAATRASRQPAERERERRREFQTDVVDRGTGKRARRCEGWRMADTEAVWYSP